MLRSDRAGPISELKKLTGAREVGEPTELAVPSYGPRDAPFAHHPTPGLTAWLVIEPARALRCFHSSWGTRDIALPEDVTRGSIAVSPDGREVVPGKSHLWLVTPEDGRIVGLAISARLGDRIAVTPEAENMVLWTRSASAFRAVLPPR